MTARGIQITSATFEGCVDEYGDSDPRGAFVMIGLADESGGIGSVRQALDFRLPRAEAKRLARLILEGI
ncbi:MAG: hypothetical protein AAGC81_02330 [Pseudomonadota bacterium]